MERVKPILFIFKFSRWCVLTSNNLSTYEKENDYTSPTEVIEISKVKTVKSDEIDNAMLVMDNFIL